MKTLVIHPADPTTDFLKTIYQGLDCEVITDQLSKGKLIRKIKENERIIMLGHGAPYGLFGHYGMMISSEHVEFLRDKPHNVYIWCHANQFVERYNLNGFYSGMFISEVGEANYCGIKTTQDEVTYSNEYFAKLVNEVVNTNIILEHVKSQYKSDTNKVIEYNTARLYYR